MTFFDWVANLLQFVFSERPALVIILAFFLLWGGCWLPIAIPLAIALHWHPIKPMAVSQKLPLLASLYLIAPLLLWGVAKGEGFSFSEYGLTGDSPVFISIFLGLSLGVLSLVIVFGIQAAFGWIDWQLAKIKQLGLVLLPLLFLGLWISTTEELVFRGFLLNELSPGSFNPMGLIDTPILLKLTATDWFAAIVSSLIFAVLHLVWEFRGTLPQLPGLWLMGMVLVLARAVDGGSLGLAVGLHAGWIWGMASLDAAQFITYTGKGAAWITGLEEKPLAGVAGMVCLLGTAAMLVVLVISH